MAKSSNIRPVFRTLGRGLGVFFIFMAILSACFSVVTRDLNLLGAVVANAVLGIGVLHLMSSAE